MKKDYYIYILARFISSFGNWFQVLAFPFVVYKITGSAVAVSLSFIIETIPSLLLAPLCANVVDSYSRKNIMRLCDIIRSVILLVCVFTRCSNLYLIYICQFLLKSSEMFFTPSANSLMPKISQGIDLKKANMLEALALNSAMIIGPLLAGNFITLYGSTIAFLIDAISFILSFIILSLLNNDVREKQTSTKDTSTFSTLRSLFNYKSLSYPFKGDTFLKMIVLIGICFSICGGIFSSLDAIYIETIFPNASEVYGYINTAWGVGMIIASSMFFLYKNISTLKMYFLGILLMGIATIGYGFSTGVFICVFFNFLGGISNTLYMVYFKTIIQENTSDMNRGKVFTAQSTISKIGSSLIIGITGLLAEKIGIGLVIAFSGIITVNLAVIGYIYHISHQKKHITSSVIR